MSKKLSLELGLDFREATDRMKEANIYGRVTIGFKNDNDEVVLELREILIKKSKKGKFFIANPSRPYKNKEGKNAYQDFFRFYPDNKEKAFSFSDMVVARAKKKLNLDEPKSSSNEPKDEVEDMLDFN